MLGWVEVGPQSLEQSKDDGIRVPLEIHVKVWMGLDPNGPLLLQHNHASLQVKQNIGNLFL